MDYMCGYEIDFLVDVCLIKCEFCFSDVFDHICVHVTGNLFLSRDSMVICEIIGEVICQVTYVVTCMVTCEVTCKVF